MNRPRRALDRARIWQYIRETSTVTPIGIRMSTRVARQRRNYIPMVLFYLIVAILAMS